MRQTFAALALCLAGTAGAQEAPPGAAACSGCHGTDPGADLSLAALDADEIAAAMRGFRDGARDGTLMPRIARGFSPDEIDAIAAWIAREDGQ